MSHGRASVRKRCGLRVFVLSGGMEAKGDFSQLEGKARIFFFFLFFGGVLFVYFTAFSVCILSFFILLLFGISGVDEGRENEGKMRRVRPKDERRLDKKYGTKATKGGGRMGRGPRTRGENARKKDQKSRGL